MSKIYESVEVCKHCGSKHLVKNGLDKRTRIQRYKCKDCKKTFVIGDKRIKHPLILRKLTLVLYLSGTSLRGIQRTISIVFNKKIAFHVINNWVMNSNGLLEQENQRRKEEYPPTGERTIIPIVEMDELYTFVKKNLKIQKERNIITNEYGLLWIDNQIKLLHLK
jgi:transposase-like protein